MKEKQTTNDKIAPTHKESQAEVQTFVIDGGNVMQPTDDRDLVVILTGGEVSP